MIKNSAEYDKNGAESLKFSGVRVFSPSCDFSEIFYSLFRDEFVLERFGLLPRSRTFPSDSGLAVRDPCISGLRLPSWLVRARVST